MNRDSLEKLRTLQISSLDEEEEDEVQVDDNMSAHVNIYDDDEERVPVTLGFVEKPKNQWSLLRQLFPSKAGGVPAWLDPSNLPSGRACVCDICGEPLQFLLQVYAPLTEKDSTFHRTLFIFMCSSMACLLQDQHEQWKRHPEKAYRSVKIFRCQLPQFNPFYSNEAPRQDGTDKPSGVGAPLCSWCGTWKAEKICSECKSARYCSGQHQAFHWQSGHRIGCKQSCISSHACSSSNSLPGSAGRWLEFLTQSCKQHSLATV